jgi:hypothetical protein
MSDDPYVYSTYGLVASIVLYGLKKLHESQCVMRNGTIQIKLSGLQNSFRRQKPINKKHTHKQKTHENQESTEEVVEQSSPTGDNEIVIDIDDSGSIDSTGDVTQQETKINRSKAKHVRGGHRSSVPPISAL